LVKVKQEKGAAEQQREEARDRLECTVCMTAERSVLFAVRAVRARGGVRGLRGGAGRVPNLPCSHRGEACDEFI
jgi:hypothetical protein